MLPRFDYSPFPCRLDQVSGEHLSALRDAPEGWYLDYKRDVPKPTDAAKSLASFANTYGGWLVYGVVARDGGSPTAESFPGIANDEVARVLEMLQRAAANCLQPAPFFETHVVRGPVPETLLEGRALVFVRVPPGAHTPYVHKDGRIFRRVADGSEPKAETDRHTLDLLWERSRATQDRWAELVEQEIVVSAGEANRPVLHFFLTSDPFGDRGERLNLHFDDFVSHMRDGSEAMGGLPFDNFFPAAGGYVARQIGQNDPYQLLFTWRQQLDTTAVVSVPLPVDSGDFSAGTWQPTDVYEHMERFGAACRASGYAVTRVLDLSYIPFVIQSILQRYRVLLRNGSTARDFFVKARVDSTWRCVPYLDLAAFAEFVETHGVPIIQDAGACAPPGVASMLPGRVQFDSADGDVELQRLGETLALLEPLAGALGVMIEGSVPELPPLMDRAHRRQLERAHWGAFD